MALGAGRDDHERHAGAFLEQAALVPEAVFAEMPAVVAGEDDDGVVRQPEPLQRVEHAAGLRIDIAHPGEIAADGRAPLLGRGA